MHEILLYFIAIVLGDIVFNWLCFGILTRKYPILITTAIIGMLLGLLYTEIPYVGIWFVTVVLFACSHAILTWVIDVFNDGDDDYNDGFNTNGGY